MTPENRDEGERVTITFSHAEKIALARVARRAAYEAHPNVGAYITARAKLEAPESRQFVADGGEGWTIYVCDRCDEISKMPLDGYACPGWDGTGREDHIGHAAEVRPASEATTLRSQLEAMEAEAIKQMRSGESAVEEHLKTHRKLQAAEADLAQLRERVERAADALTDARNGLDFGLAGWRRVEGNIAGPDNATPACARIMAHLERARAAEREVRAALEPPPPDTQEVGDGE